MIIVLSPYSGNEEYNYFKNLEFTEKLMKEGKQVFSPVVYGHQFKSIEGSFKTWEFLNRFFEAADEIYILCLMNWHNSVGLQMELKKIYSMVKFIQVTYFDHDYNEIRKDNNYI